MYGISLSSNCNTNVTIVGQSASWNKEFCSGSTNFTQYPTIAKQSYTLNNTNIINFIDPLPLCSLHFLTGIDFEFDHNIDYILLKCSIVNNDDRQIMQNKPPSNYHFLPGSDVLTIREGNIEID